MALSNNTIKYMGTALEPSIELAHAIKNYIAGDLELPEELVTDFAGRCFRDDFCIDHDMLLKYGVIDPDEEVDLEHHGIYENEDFVVDSGRYTMKPIAFLMCLIDDAGQEDLLSYIIIILNAVYKFANKYYDIPVLRHYSYQYMNISKVLTRDYEF